MKTQHNQKNLKKLLTQEPLQWYPLSPPKSSCLYVDHWAQGPAPNCLLLAPRSPLCT